MEIINQTSSDIELNGKTWAHRLLVKIFKQAESEDASDIHFDRKRNSIKIRLRKHGDLIQVFEKELSPTLLTGVTNILKRMSNMNMMRNDIIQDRSFELTTTSTTYRAALEPSKDGEVIVLRIIKNTPPPTIKELGFETNFEEALMSSMKAKKGLVLITGSTGSGKSTTIESAIYSMNATEKKILTIQDPCERDIPGATQTMVTESCSWDDLAKISMRMDPDIIYIGEIRCKESAEFALKMAQTGHLVFSTIHTNDVFGVLKRLDGIGVNSEDIMENVLLVTTQELVKVPCPLCTTSKICKDCESSLNKGTIKRVPLNEFAPGDCFKGVENLTHEEFYEKNNIKRLSVIKEEMMGKGMITI